MFKIPILVDTSYNETMRILNIIFGFIFCISALEIDALYVKIDVLNGTAGIMGPYDTDNQINYNHLYSILEKAESNSSLFDQWPAIKEYQKTLWELSQLSANVAATLIDSQWAIGATHVFPSENIGYSIISRSGKPYPLDGQMPLVESVIPHAKFDVCLIRLGSVITDKKPVQRYRGTGEEASKKKCYVFSDAMHNSGGGVVSHHNHPLFGWCKIVNPVNTGNNMQMIDKSPITVRTYGGDSSCPIFIKTKETDDPFEDYQLLGINSGPNGNSMNAVYLYADNINTWIDNIIIKNAITAPTITVEQDKYQPISHGFLGTAHDRGNYLSQIALIDSSWLLVYAPGVFSFGTNFEPGSKIDLNGKSYEITKVNLIDRKELRLVKLDRPCLDFAPIPRARINFVEGEHDFGTFYYVNQSKNLEPNKGIEYKKSSSRGIDYHYLSFKDKFEYPLRNSWLLTKSMDGNYEIAGVLYTSNTAKVFTKDRNTWIDNRIIKNALEH